MSFDSSAVMPLWLDYVPEAVVVFNQQDKIQGWNRAAEKLFRYTTSDAIGQSFLLFVPHQQQLIYAEACQAARKHAKWVGELRMATALYDPLRIEANWSHVPETDVIVGLFSDVSHARQQEELRRQAAEWTTACTVMNAVMESLSGHEPQAVQKKLRSFLQAADPLEACSLYRGNGEHVLVAVRDPLNREFARVLLDAAGYRPTVANDRFHAARLASDPGATLSAAVVDYGTDAKTVMTELRRWQPLVPIIAVGTTEADPYQTIPEPVDSIELLQAIAEAVADTKLRDETLYE